MALRSILVTALLAFAPTGALANLTDVFCGDTQDIKDQLITVVGAEQQGRGLRGPDALLEIWIVPRSGDWTIVQNYANGTSCVVAMGEDWEAITAEPA
ncbi:MAG: hypothetical protein AAFU41_15505 [Pseudomonadota bacterium]